MSASERPLVSAAIIVKNEAEYLRRCLGSIAHWVDELVVVDTGSTDDTVEVARSFGAELGHFPWIDDFSAARNHALDMATGEWILYIDADEQVEPVTREEAFEELRRVGDAISLQLLKRDRPGFSPFRDHRMWRNRPDIRFEGCVHETSLPFIVAIAAREGLPMPDTDVFRIVHDGYEADMTPKYHRYIPLLERRISEWPTRVFLWNHLGQCREGLGDFEGAERAFRSGLDVVHR